jgi:hypothetical protein
MMESPEKRVCRETRNPCPRNHETGVKNQENDDAEGKSGPEISNIGDRDFDSTTQTLQILDN